MYVFCLVPPLREYGSKEEAIMPVSSICTRNVATIGRDVDVLEAAAKMRSAHVGDLIVVDYQAGRRVPVGIVTDRDIVVGVVAQQVDPKTLTVGDIMSGELLT